MVLMKADLVQHKVNGATPTQTRTLAGRWLFAGPTATVSEDLYAVVDRGSVSRRRCGVTLAPGTNLSGNTYFGRFPATYWQRWTNVREVRVELTVTGAGRVSVAASDVNGFARVVATRTVPDGDREQIALVAALDRFADGGALWLELETTGGRPFTVENVCWTTVAPKTVRTTSLAFCTFNRPQYCLGILRALIDDRTALDLLDRIYVIDQGSERMSAHEGYGRVAASLGGRVRYVTQPNLGSAGGLNRSLYEEALRSRTGPASVLFLDDDVLLDPELVIRVVAFGDHLTQPAIVGGQMLNIFHPHILLADAQRTDIDGIEPGIPMPHSRIDIDLLKPDAATGRPGLQERRLDAGYNAWWACLVPMELVAELGYLLPMFFQGDDAEFCYRARAGGIPTITLPGAALWHTDFALKDADDTRFYFMRRNYMILSALHGELTVGPLARKLAVEVGQCLLAMQYGLAASVLAAVDHFLAGPDDLHDGGAERVREIGALRAQFPETRCHRVTAIPGLASHELTIVTPGRPPRHPVLFALARVLGQLLGRHHRAVGAVAHDEAHWWHVCRLRTAVVTDGSQEGVRVRRFDRAQLLRLAGQATTTLGRLWWTGAAMRRRYRDALPRLTSRAEWTRLYGLD